MTDSATCQVSFACNDRQGRCSGRFGAFEVDFEGGRIGLRNPGPRDTFIRIDESWVRIGRRTFRFVEGSRQHWVGNMSWDAVTLRFEATKSLLKYLGSEGWFVEEADESMQQFVEIIEPIARLEGSHG